MLSHCYECLSGCTSISKCHAGKDTGLASPGELRLSRAPRLPAAFKQAQPVPAGAVAGPHSRQWLGSRDLRGEFCGGPVKKGDASSRNPGPSSRTPGYSPSESAQTFARHGRRRTENAARKTRSLKRCRPPPLVPEAGTDRGSCRKRARLHRPGLRHSPLCTPRGGNYSFPDFRWTAAEQPPRGGPAREPRGPLPTLEPRARLPPDIARAAAQSTASARASRRCSPCILREQTLQPQTWSRGAESPRRPRSGSRRTWSPQLAEPPALLLLLPPWLPEP